MQEKKPFKIDPEKQRQIEMLVTAGHTDEFICAFYSISWSQWREAVNGKLTFSRNLRKWKDRADHEVEKSLYKAAIGYQIDEDRIFYNSQLNDVKVIRTQKNFPPDTKAAIHWLNNRKKEEWKNRREDKLEVESPLADAILRARRRTSDEEDIFG